MEINQDQHEKASGTAVPWLTSCRLSLALVGMFGTTCIYLMRVNMGVAIVCMTCDTNCTQPVADNNLTTAARPKESVNHIFGFQAIDIIQEGNSKKGEFDWDRQLRGWVLSSFFLGYIVTQLPGGWLASRFGAKNIITVAVGLLSVFTLLTPVAARVSVYLLMVVQSFKGLTSGVYYPALYQVLGRWTTTYDRSIMIAFILSGDAIGMVLSSILSGMLCEYGFDGGWPSIFYIFGLAGLTWCCVWYFMGFDSPDQHPRISTAELSYIHELTPPNLGSSTPKVPWKKLLSSIPLHAIYIATCGQMWSLHVAIAYLPQYMKDVLEFDMTQNGLYNSLPYLVGFGVAISGSMLADFLLSKHVFSITRTRKLFQSLGMIPSACMSLGVAFLPADQIALAVTLLTLWVGLLAFARAGVNSNTIELAPRYSGVVMGIVNTMTNLPGVIAPPVVAAIVTTGSTGEWQQVFILNSAICVCGWLVYMVCGNSEEQEWAKVESDDDKMREVYVMDNQVFTGTLDEFPGNCEKDVLPEGSYSSRF